jgi:hypothetical protein
MEPIILDKIEFNPSNGRVFKKLRVKKGSRQVDLVLSLLNQAREIARPRAVYTIAGIDERDSAGVVVDGIRLNSRVMAVNLRDVNRVFPFIATCGRELYDWKSAQEDLIDTYYADEIGQMALRTATSVLLDHLKETYQLGKSATMNPGSLDDWPVTAQRSLFQLLRGQASAIGVDLLDSMLMIPNQTVSGIRFESEEGYSNCELCPRDCCTHRRAPYNEELLQERYQSR